MDQAKTVLKRFSLVRSDATFSTTQISRIEQELQEISAACPSPYKGVTCIRLIGVDERGFEIAVDGDNDAFHRHLSNRLCQKADLFELRDLGAKNHLFHVTRIED